MTVMKPSVSFLPMNDIAGYLIENNDFTTKDQMDKTLSTAVESLAKAVDGDRDTVKNALNLNGIEASEYLTRKDATKIEGITDVMNKLYSDEIQNLREELYQLRSQLGKDGFVDEDILYEGFIDTFKKNNIKYDKYVCGVKESSPVLTDVLYIDDLEKIKDFEVGKHFTIVKNDTAEKDIVTILESNDSGKVKFYPSTNLLTDATVVELWKTYGNYIRNSFSFSEITSGVDLGSQERYHMQSDDTMTAARAINSSSTGIATSFKIPSTCVPNDKAALISFSVTTKAIGNPGNLICHLIDESAGFTNGILSPTFISVEDAKDKGLVIASSQPIKAENALQQTTLSFDFFDKELNSYPEVEDKRYIFLIECVNADENNYWNLYFSYYRNDANEVDDLERYNVSLNYKAVDGIDPDEKSLYIIDDIDKYDLLFTLAVKDIIEQTEYGNKEGLYTAKIILPKPIDVSRARLSMRINREGCYYTDLSSISDDFTEFTLYKEDEYSYSNTDLRFDENDIIIIGNQFGKVKKCTSNRVTLQEPLYLDYRIEKLYTKNNSVVKIPVYRMNYEASITPYLIDWNDFDLTTKQFNSEKISESVLDLNLTNIIPINNNKLGSRISDKLLFETKYGEDDEGFSKYANEFELQIKWKSKFEYNEINKAENIQNKFNELIGRIHELVLTFDKIY